MRILMLSWRGPNHPKAGGAEVYTEQILEEMVQRGHEVIWYSAKYEGNMPKVHKGIQLAYGANSMNIYVSGHFFARKCKADVVVDQINTLGFLSGFIKRPKVVLIHQLAKDVWDYEVKFPINFIGKIIERAVLSTYKKVPFIAVSKSTFDDLREIGWRGEGSVVHNSVDVGQFYEKTKNPTMVFLARFGAKAKRLEHAVSILREVRKTLPTAELVIIGRGVAPEWVKTEAGIQIHQNVSNEERDRLIGSAWCCIATSVREGWGRMVLESAANGTPSIVYNVHGLRDAVVHGVTGFIVNENANEAAEKMTELFTQHDMRITMNKAAYNHARTFTLETSVNQFEEVMKGLSAIG